MPPVLHVHVQVEIRNGASVHTDWHNRNPERFLVENHRYSVYVGLPLIAVGLFTPIPLNQGGGNWSRNGSVTLTML